MRRSVVQLRTRTRSRTRSEPPYYFGTNPLFLITAAILTGIELQSLSIKNLGKFSQISNIFASDGTYFLEEFC